ncbi:hypothetical protein MNBD_ALPHA03-1272 [hydrothermal vent metagenome]|uniref:Uncharacterized protein n=1 Tax=hydrothermal vent metagenome TaxID=652676 RepID=A0A3B1BTF6_9ZZZZ
MKEELKPYEQWVYHKKNPQGKIVSLSGDESERKTEMKALTEDGFCFTPKALSEQLKKKPK